MDKRNLKDVEYLGDGVYSGYDGFYIWIWTSDGVTDSDMIGIEPKVFMKLHSKAIGHWNFGKART